MALITWDDDFSVGVAEIDRQHKKIIVMINELDNATNAGKEKDVIGRILDDLIIYTATHFRVEEKYFAQFAYPDAQIHIKEHLACIDMAEKFSMKFNKEFASGKPALTAELMSFLGDWWKYHILGADKQYTKLFNEKGLR